MDIVLPCVLSALHHDISDCSGLGHTNQSRAVVEVCQRMLHWERGHLHQAGDKEHVLGWTDPVSIPSLTGNKPPMSQSLHGKATLSTAEEACCCRLLIGGVWVSGSPGLKAARAPHQLQQLDRRPLAGHSEPSVRHRAHGQDGPVRHLPGYTGMDNKQLETFRAIKTISLC